MHKTRRDGIDTLSWGKSGNKPSQMVTASHRRHYWRGAIHVYYFWCPSAETTRCVSRLFDLYFSVTTLWVCAEMLRFSSGVCWKPAISLARSTKLRRASSVETGHISVNEEEGLLFVNSKEGNHTLYSTEAMLMRQTFSHLSCNGS